MTTYTFTKSSRYCSTEAHSTGPSCADCTNTGNCSGCQNAIGDGERHLICDENGEAIHPGCKATAAARWVDYY